MQQQLMHHVHTLAQWERLSGSAAERAAFAYLEEELKRSGVATRRLDHEAYISLPGRAALTVLGPAPQGLRCITHSFSRATPPGGLDADLVYVGQGTPADYAGQDVAGKVVLIDGLAAPGPTVIANQHGASGQIHINPGPYIHEMIVSPVWGNPTREQADHLPNTVVLSVNADSGRLLQERLAAGTVRVHLEAAVDTGWRRIPLLEAQIDGQDEAEDFVLFSGHVDSWYVGAMDNGSANAVMLEIARTFAKRPLRRSLRLCFWSGHSHGRYAGSAWYVDQHWAELNRHCVAHVNVDSPGGRGATVLSEPQAMQEAAALLRDVLAPLTDEPIKLRRVPRAGDHSFWGVGVTSLLVGPSEQLAGPATYNPLSAIMGSDEQAAGYGWWWHTADDTPAHLDPALLERDYRLYETLLARLTGDAVVPLDFRPVVAELAATMATLQQTLAPHLDLTPAVVAVQRLAQAVARLHAGDCTLPATAINQALLQLGRHLIPLLYTENGRFIPDPALGVTPLPSLQPLRTLGPLAPGSDAARFGLVAALRARNYFVWCVEQATAAAGQELAGLVAGSQQTEVFPFL